MNGRPFSVFKPTKADLAASAGKMLPDLIRPGLKVVFCGINPGLYSAAVSHHFARPGNRFWPALHQGGFTPRRFLPHEEHDLLGLGYGITNIVPRATATAAELGREELIAGGEALTEKMVRYQPTWVAILGIDAYRQAFGKKQARAGRQPDCLAGTNVWLLPSPSGLNAHYTPFQLGEAFAAFKHEAGV